ncbi:uncharacterized protein B0I36DRAFT_329268 [Microdochium trichocladiopsis]|uniref:Uncharacterized protein n=1 Tax=Microdochium trichocladiopsis TaxID=1682393 RepID=A0A9P8XZQ3_9PEZI|nr:uncharacterized protein B0I36DRAFT_329268 [Microdochium trichocladiopsis]KAH7025850.1 hypothetical protein B0I36DRAFT_329268 [Microdochium trichocladiopsis]
MARWLARKCLPLWPPIYTMCDVSVVAKGLSVSVLLCAAHKKLAAQKQRTCLLSSTLRAPSTFQTSAESIPDTDTGS